MQKVKSFEDLEVWQNARLLNQKIYEISQMPGLSNDYSLKDQMLRSCGSVMDNIAEGFDRNGNKQFIYFLKIAKGSCAELQSQLYRCLDRSYIIQTTFDDLMADAQRCSKMLGGLIRYLKGKI